VKTGVQKFCSQLKKLDSGACPGPRSGIRRNDKKWCFLTFYEIIKIDAFIFLPTKISVFTLAIRFLRFLLIEQNYRGAKPV